MGKVSLSEKQWADTALLRRAFRELRWREKEVIDGELSAYDLSNRLVSIAWRIQQNVIPELAKLLNKYDNHVEANHLGKLFSAMAKCKEETSADKE